MAFKMQPAQFPGVAQGFPDSDAQPVTAAQTFPDGTPLIFDAAGTLSEHPIGATLDFVGISFEGANAGVPFNPDNRVNFASSRRGNTFMAKFTDNAGVPVAITQTIVGEARALIKVGTGLTAFWTVLNTGGTNAVEIVGFDLNIDKQVGQGNPPGGVVFFKFLEAATNIP